LALQPPHPPSLVSKLDRRHTGIFRKRDNMLTGEAYDREKAWSHINHSILSGYTLRKRCKKARRHETAEQ
jgi:hypothetical protein